MLVVDEPADRGRHRHRPLAHPARSPPASPAAPRSRSRCTPSARAGTSAQVEVDVDVEYRDGSPVLLRGGAAAAERAQRRAAPSACSASPASARSTRSSPAKPTVTIAERARGPDLMDLGLGGPHLRRHRRQPRHRRARRRGCSAPRAPTCCWSRATRSGCAAVQEAAARGRAEDGGRAAVLALDVTDDDAGERMLAAATERFGSLDVLVNNAGSRPAGATSTTSPTRTGAPSTSST